MGALHMSAFWGKADITFDARTVLLPEHRVNKVHGFSTSVTVVFMYCSVGNCREEIFAAFKICWLQRFFWCCRCGLNTRPPPYQGGALPLSYASNPRAT